MIGFAPDISILPGLEELPKTMCLFEFVASVVSLCSMRALPFYDGPHPHLVHQLTQLILQGPDPNCLHLTRVEVPPVDTLDEDGGIGSDLLAQLLPELPILQRFSQHSGVQNVVCCSASPA